MLPSQLLTLVCTVGLVAAVPQIQPAPDVAVCPRTICIDGLNPDCPDIRWGGCYDTCKPHLKPTMRPCPSTTRSLTSVTRGTTRPPVPTRTISSVSDDSCSSHTVCVDYINECGQMYGGCHAACRPWPSYSAPACSSSRSVTYGLPVRPTPP